MATTSTHNAAVELAKGAVLDVLAAFLKSSIDGGRGGGASADDDAAASKRRESVALTGMLAAASPSFPWLRRVDLKAKLSAMRSKEGRDEDGEDGDEDGGFTRVYGDSDHSDGGGNGNANEKRPAKKRKRRKTVLPSQTNANEPGQQPPPLGSGGAASASASAPAPASASVSASASLDAPTGSNALNGNQQAKIAAWELRIGQCREFREKHGHLRIPNKYGDEGLGRWIQKIRQKYADGKLTEDEISELRGLGFETRQEIRADTFNRMMRLLEEYKAEHGHTRVSTKDSQPWTELYKWVAKTRTEYVRLRAGKQSPLSVTELQRLNDVGFTFTHDPNRAKGERLTTEQRLEMCREFREQHGHLRIPRSHPTLGEWTGKMRKEYRNKTRGMKSTLTDETQAELESMGFVWLAGTRMPAVPANGRRMTWEERFDEMLEFKRQYGHCMVPQHYHTGLGRWVNRLRKECKLFREGGNEKTTITAERMLMLTNAGFVFEMGRGQRSEYY